MATTTRSAVTHAARRVQHGRRAAVEARDARALVDAHAELERDPAQPAREPRRLHDRGRRLEQARDVAVRAAAPRGLLGRPLLERHHAELAAGRHHAVPGAQLRLRRGRPEVPAAVVVRVDAVLARRSCRSRRRPSSAARAIASAPSRAAQLDERGELGPPGEHEAAVAPARAAAADVLLEHDDVAGRLALLDADRRPEAGVAAAHDRDVGAGGALERRGGGLVRRERLVEPERAMRHGPEQPTRGLALDARQHLGGGVRRALLGRLVEVDRDAVPLVEMHRRGLVRERDAAHRALHVDARQDGHHVGWPRSSLPCRPPTSRR